MQKSMDIKEMAAFIQAERKRNNLTQKELGAKVGVSDKAVSKWERGLSFPDITILPSLSCSLGVTVGELISASRIAQEDITQKKLEKVVDKTMEYSNKSNAEKSKKIVYLLTMALFTVASAVCMIVNLAIEKRLTWAIIPVFAMCMVAILLGIAFFSKKKRVELLFGIGFLAVVLFLFVIEKISKTGPWVFKLGLPIATLAFICSYVVAKLFYLVRSNFYYPVASIFVCSAVLSVGIDVVVKMNYIYPVNNISSLIVAPISLVIAVILLLFGKIKSSKMAK